MPMCDKAHTSVLRLCPLNTSSRAGRVLSSTSQHLFRHILQLQHACCNLFAQFTKPPKDSSFRLPYISIYALPSPHPQKIWCHVPYHSRAIAAEPAFRTHNPLASGGWCVADIFVPCMSHLCGRCTGAARFEKIFALQDEIGGECPPSRSSNPSSVCCGNDMQEVCWHVGDFVIPMSFMKPVYLSPFIGRSNVCHSVLL